MPIPVYLICSESGAIDGDTKVSSLFNIVEQITAPKPPPLPEGMTYFSTPWLLTAYWMREDTDSVNDEYEIKFSVVPPNSTEEKVLMQGAFRFATRFQRIRLNNFQIAPYFAHGVLRLQASLRKQGDKEWQTISYFIDCIEVEPDPSKPFPTLAMAKPPTPPPGPVPLSD